MHFSSISLTHWISMSIIHIHLCTMYTYFVGDAFHACRFVEQLPNSQIDEQMVVFCNFERPFSQSNGSHNCAKEWIGNATQCNDLADVYGQQNTTTLTTIVTFSKQTYATFISTSILLSIVLIQYTFKAKKLFWIEHICLTIWICLQLLIEHNILCVNFNAYYKLRHSNRNVSLQIILWNHRILLDFKDI